jgi:hypothetical protein
MSPILCYVVCIVDLHYSHPYLSRPTMLIRIVNVLMQLPSMKQLAAFPIYYFALSGDESLRRSKGDWHWPGTEALFDLNR